VRKIDFWFLTPTVLVLLVLIAFPLAQVIFQSFTNAKLFGKTFDFVGFKNYIKLLHDGRFWNSVNVTLILAGGSLLLQVGFGLGLALLVHLPFRISKLGRILFIVPIVLPPVVVGIVWKMLFSPILPGVNYFLSLVGIEGPVWFDRGLSARCAVIFAHAWYCIPFVMLMFLAGLESLPQDPITAAVVDGANRWQILRFIMIPLLKPVIIFVAIYRAVQALKIFGLIYIMTGGGPGVTTEPMNFHIWRVGFSSYKVGYASTIAVMMMIIIASIVLIMGWYGRKTGAIK
jgi:multiple sugar transport system permease protein